MQCCFPKSFLLSHLCLCSLNLCLVISIQKAVVLSKTTNESKKSERIADNLHFWSRVKRSQKTRAGVSTLVKKHLQKINKNFECKSERLVSVTLSL